MCFEGLVIFTEFIQPQQRLLYDFLRGKAATMQTCVASEFRHRMFPLVPQMHHRELQVSQIFRILRVQTFTLHSELASHCSSDVADVKLAPRSERPSRLVIR